MPEHVPVFDHLRGHPNIFYGMGFNGTGIAQTPIAASWPVWCSSARTGGAPAALSVSTGGWHCLQSRSAISAPDLCAAYPKNDIEIRNGNPDVLTRFLAQLTLGHRKQQ